MPEAHDGGRVPILVVAGEHQPNAVSGLEAPRVIDQRNAVAHDCPIGTASKLVQGKTGAPGRLASGSTLRKLARRYPAVTSVAVPEGSTSCSVAKNAVSPAVAVASSASSTGPIMSRSRSSGSLVHTRMDGGSVSLA